MERRNEELWERTGQETVKSVISRRKWIGHTLRKPKDNITAVEFIRKAKSGEAETYLEKGNGS